MQGDFSAESMRDATISGGIEGLTVGTLHWVGGKISGKNRVKKLDNSRSSQIRSLTKAEAAETYGGAKATGVSNATSWGMWKDLSKNTYKGKIYANLNGRLYTHEAIDRMTPTAFGTAINGYQSRGIPTSVVEDVMKNGSHYEVIRDNVVRTIFEHNGVRVVTEEVGKIIITVMKFSS